MPRATLRGVLPQAELDPRSAQDLDREQVMPLIIAVAVGGIVGARLLFLVQDDVGSLLRPGDWLGTTGFSFYGAIVLGAGAAAAYMRRARLGPSYLDALATGAPLNP